jgi:hypothetical protein
MDVDRTVCARCFRWVPTREMVAVQIARGKRLVCSICAARKNKPTLSKRKGK